MKKLDGLKAHMEELAEVLGIFEGYYDEVD
jgi:hypothetical protein